MRTRERIIVAAVIVPLMFFTTLVLGALYRFTRPPRELPGVPLAVVEQRSMEETTFATAGDVETTIPSVPSEEIVMETSRLAETELAAQGGRREICVRLFRDAGFDPVITKEGDVLAFKVGLTTDYVAVGAHYDKADGPSLGILDNMLGCILVAKAAKAVRNHETNYEYLFLAYGDEEAGRKIGSAVSSCRRESRRRPVHVIEIDYVGDRAGELGGRWLSPTAGGFLKTGIKITTYPMPDPPTIHTERDNLDSVDFARVHLAYKTVISLIDGIEQGTGLRPPDTVNFWRREDPLNGKGSVEK